jgi:4-carboxymuconolactone decarboxylase
VSRLPYLTREQLTPAQIELWNRLNDGRRGKSSEILTPEGGLVGPANAMLYDPKVGSALAALAEALRFESPLDSRIREAVILVVGAHWQSNFEFSMHSAIARQVGLSDEAITELRDGQIPDSLSEEARAACAFASELLRTSEVSDETYAEAVSALGENSLVEITFLIGYYCLISLTLNAFRIGESGQDNPIWERAFTPPRTSG